MRFAIALVFNNFDVGFRVEAGFYAQVVIILLTAGVILWLYKKHKRSW